MLAQILWAIVLVPLLLVGGFLVLLYLKARQRSRFPPPAVGNSSVIVISGCDTGIGRETAKYLAKLGFHVVVTVLNPALGKSLQDEASGEISYYQVDITNDEQIQEFGRQLRELLQASPAKRLVGLVNNAGIAVMGPLEYISHKAMQRQLDVNLVGHNTMTAVLVALLRESKGRIVNIVSCAGRTAAGLMGPYCASKFGMEAITDAMRLELQQFGISVSAIEPGFIRTPLVQGVAEDWEAEWSKFPAEAKQLYKLQYVSGQSGMQMVFRNAPSPIIVAEKIAHALTSEYPKTRYLVGTDAIAYAAVAYLPDRMRDALLEMLSKLAGSR